MSTTWFDLFRDLWNLFMGILTFLAANTALGAWVRDLSVRFEGQLRSWGFKWPEPPVSPDLQERRKAHAELLALLSQNRDASYAISQALRDMMGQDTNHHEEIRGILSESRDTLSEISSDARRIVAVNQSLASNSSAPAGGFGVKDYETSYISTGQRWAPHGVSPAKGLHLDAMLGLTTFG
ncbi:hypothetical protein LA080_015788 [Diaporthe eres]|nr:hypothetical protein LA080_015788 [Diaporthe eres]